MTVAYDKNWDLKDDGRISPSIIPTFHKPVNKWISAVIRILSVAGVRNFNAPNLGMQVIPIIVTRLLSEISEIVPIDVYSSRERS